MFWLGLVIGGLCGTAFGIVVGAALVTWIARKTGEMP